jgi:hypothetical protein
MTMRIDGPILNMPALPDAPASPAAPTSRLAATKEQPRFRPANPLGPSAPAVDQATQGVTMLEDPKLSFWPSFLSGKKYRDVDQLPLTGERECGTLDDEIWVPHVRQGALGDCWFMGTLAAMALAKDPQYHPGIRRIDDEHVAVKFGDRQFGVEDDLPFNRKGKLLYARQNTPHFEATWPVYYEKAAASLLGGYDALEGGWPAEAFELLLGTRPTEVRKPADVIGYLDAALDAGLPVAVTTRSEQTELMDDVKLHSNHTYAVRKVFTGGGDGSASGTVGVKLWNPWGDEHPKILTPEQFEALCDTVTTPKEGFGWNGVRAVPG